MRSLLFFLYSILFLILPTNASATQYPVSVTINVEKYIVKSDEDVIVKIILKNTSDNDIEIFIPKRSDNGEFQYRIEVLDNYGNTVNKTKYGNSIYNENSLLRFSNVSIKLKSDFKQVNSAIINKIYDISAIGEYTIKVKYKLPESLGGGIVTSNDIVVTVIP